MNECKPLVAGSMSQALPEVSWTMEKNRLRMRSSDSCTDGRTDTARHVIGCD